MLSRLLPEGNGGLARIEVRTERDAKANFSERSSARMTKALHEQTLYTFAGAAAAVPKRQLVSWKKR
jgi:hypothetical protein